MGKTFTTQLSPAMLKVDPKNLESIRQLKFNPVKYNGGDKMVKKLLWNISTLIKITKSCKLSKYFMISVILIKMSKHSDFHLIFSQVEGA